MQKEADAILDEFRAAFRDRYRRAQEEKDRGRRVMGWLCLYAPEELFQAAGMLPLRVMGGEGETQQADAHLYSNFCSFVRSCLEEGFKGHYDLLDGLVTCNNCDHIRHLYDVWSRYLKTPYTCILGLPHKMSEAGTAFFAGELRRLKGELETAFGVGITAEGLRQAIDLYNHTRALLRQLYALRRSPTPPLGGAEVMDVLKAAMVMPKAEFNRLLEGLLEQLKERPGETPAGPRLMLLGSELDDSDYVRIIEGLGAIVVADDLCLGSRYFWDPVGPEGQSLAQESNGDPLEALAWRYLTHSPCPRMYPREKRMAFVQEMAQAFQVEGVIYQKIKFCSLHAGHYPLLGQVLERLGLPILILEREYNTAAVGQMKTRVQAFLEMLAG